MPGTNTSINTARHDPTRLVWPKAISAKWQGPRVIPALYQFHTSFNTEDVPACLKSAKNWSWTQYQDGMKVVVCTQYQDQLVHSKANTRPNLLQSIIQPSYIVTNPSMIDSPQEKPLPLTGIDVDYNFFPKISNMISFCSCVLFLFVITFNIWRSQNCIYIHILD